MLPIKNLRSVVAQVTHGRTSVVSRRNFYSNPNPTNETKEAGGNIFAAGIDHLTAAMERSIETASKMRLAPASYLMLGCCASGIWELIKLGEYRRVSDRTLEEDVPQHEISSMRLWLVKK